MNAIERLLLMKDPSGYKAKEEIGFLKMHRFDILFFDHKEGKDKKVWMCVTKIKLLQ